MKMIAALDQFGFSSLDLKPADFLEPRQAIQLGYPPNRIDIMTTLEGVEFETCYESRVVANVDNVEMNFIDLVSLKKNKRATGRLQDLADIENLES